MTEVPVGLLHFTEEVRLLLDRDPIEGLRRWSELFTSMRQAGQYDLCEELLVIIKGMEFPEYGVGIVRYGQGWLYDRSGKWKEAIEAYEEALQTFTASGLPLAVEILVQIGSLYQDQGYWDAAQDAYDRAMAIAEERENRSERAAILNNLGGLWSLRHDYRCARRYFEEAKIEFGACGDRYNEAAATVGLAGTLIAEGCFQDASDQIVEAITAFQQLGDAHGIATSVAALALTYHSAGRLPEARHNYRAAMEIFISISDRAGIAKTLANLALVLQEMDETDEAVGLTEQAIAAYQEIGDRHGEVLAQVNLAQLHKIRGDVDAMIATAKIAAALCTEHHYPDQLARMKEQSLLHDDT